MTSAVKSKLSGQGDLDHQAVSKARVLFFQEESSLSLLQYGYLDFLCLQVFRFACDACACRFN